MSGSRKARPVLAPGSDYSPSKPQDLDTLVMENARIKQEVKDMEGRVNASIADAVQASREGTAELKTQMEGLMAFFSDPPGGFN